MTQPHSGTTFDATGVRFSVVSHHADTVWLCLFDEPGNKEIRRFEMDRTPGGRFSVHVPGLKPGQKYGYRADGPWEPHIGHRYDISKLLVDPHATRIDRPFHYQPELAAKAVDTAALMPKAILEAPDEYPCHKPVKPVAGGLIYEVPVRAFSRLNPDIPEEVRGTLAAIAHPASLAHFKKLGVATVELMPITAWIDERHLKPHGLSNAWGYNPGCFMALDPRMAPSGFADLRAVADALHAEGISLILDVVFNHTGESDVFGPVLSLRGLDNALYFRHHLDEPGALVNDTGTGNTLALERAPVRDLVMGALRVFVSRGGVDGFRFDLATVLGRTARGFSPHAPLFEAIRHDAIVSDALLVAEPWDLGPGGYQLGHFPQAFLEWNDRYRDDIRRFWRGDSHTLGSLATRLAGSSDFFSQNAEQTRTVNFIAAHDGMTLADVTSYKRKHNLSNGENDHDGHNENFSWNHGQEGETPAPAIRAKRLDDVRAMLALLFVSRGTPLIAAGDEFGRTQKGNNNAYAQDNKITWLDWKARNAELENYVAELSALRSRHRVLQSTALLKGSPVDGKGLPDIQWLRANGEPMQVAEWEDVENRFLSFVLSLPSQGKLKADQVAVLINRNEGRIHATLPALPKGRIWHPAVSSKAVAAETGGWALPNHCVAVFEVKPA